MTSAASIIRDVVTPIATSAGFVFITCGDDGMGALRCTFKRLGGHHDDRWSVRIWHHEVAECDNASLKRTARRRARKMIGMAARHYADQDAA